MMDVQTEVYDDAQNIGGDWRYRPKRSMRFRGPASESFPGFPVESEQVTLGIGIEAATK